MSWWQYDDVQIAAGKRLGVFLKFDFLLCLFLLGLGASASTILAQAPGTFRATGNMTTARFGHTATLLADGRVLVAGGGGVSAELYDPSTGTFTATGNMTTARAGHTATLLGDGRVLIAGGSNDFLASAELYDPSTGTFTSVGNPTASSMYGTNTATLLPDGRVLLAGVPFRAELYDPSLGTITATGNGTMPPAFQTATLLPDGKVLLAAYGVFTSKLYDPRTGTFNDTGNQDGFESTATLLANGQVLVTGGNNDPGPNTLAEVYDSSTGIFTFTGNMIAPRANHTATLLPDGKALITGGSSWIGWGTGSMYYSCCLSSAELYDTAAGLFAPTGSMTAGRAFHTATLLNSGEILIAGGGYSGGAVATAELYHPEAPIPAPLLLAIAAMKAAAGTNSLNFWQWAYYWQNAPAFAGAPNGFGVSGSISPDLMAQITAAGGGNVLLNVSAEQWVLYYRQVAPAN